MGNEVSLWIGKKSVSFKETPEIIDDSIKSNYHTVEKIQKRKKDTENKEIENTPIKSSKTLQNLYTTPAPLNVLLG